MQPAGLSMCNTGTLLAVYCALVTRLNCHATTTGGSIAGVSAPARCVSSQATMEGRMARKTQWNAMHGDMGVTEKAMARMGRDATRPVSCTRLVREYEGRPGCRVARLRAIVVDAERGNHHSELRLRDAVTVS